MPTEVFWVVKPRTLPVESGKGSTNCEDFTAARVSQGFVVDAGVDLGAGFERCEGCSVETDRQESRFCMGSVGGCLTRVLFQFIGWDRMVGKGVSGMLCTITCSSWGASKIRHQFCTLAAITGSFDCIADTPVCSCSLCAASGLHGCLDCQVAGRYIRSP